MKKFVSVATMVALISFSFISCGGNKTADANAEVETVEVVEAVTCCKVDSAAVCTQSACDSTKTCKEEKGECTKEAGCKKDTNCAKEKK